ncbi:HesA/MoeB/ThiF family protein [Algicella marina]|uniref:HesA/MoeB/ThiF family protein n=1 Tax=Algicella marina TaxID=2683284 RepID=A0A6P1T2Y5_9RHOB|nr:HesA/MoeB/ThiF family protein [Algicella marina]QHQ36023.1 HesA/MoeB/ThiF family protein [Algicella marina]
MSRYARQMKLPEVGSEGQARLCRSHVAVVGAGGLGCPVLQYLAGAGVGQITLLDPDIVEESNLHRQPLYRMDDIGRAKADVAADFVRSTNPDVMITALAQPLGPTAAPQLATDADVVIDAADSFAVTYILSDACRATGTPLVSASVLGQSGYVGGFCGDAPSVRALFPELPAKAGNCSTDGVLGPVVGTIGALQAQMTIHILLGLKSTVLGRIVTLDLAGYRFGGFTFRGTPEPENSIPFIAAAMLTAEDLVIELRSATEAPEPFSPTAIRIAPETVVDLPPSASRRTVLCCASGLRASRAASALALSGHEHLALIASSASA